MIQACRITTGPSRSGVLGLPDMTGDPRVSGAVANSWQMPPAADAIAQWPRQAAIRTPIPARSPSREIGLLEPPICAQRRRLRQDRHCAWLARLRGRRPGTGEPIPEPERVAAALAGALPERRHDEQVARNPNVSGRDLQGSATPAFPCGSGLRNRQKNKLPEIGETRLLPSPVLGERGRGEGVSVPRDKRNFSAWDPHPHPNPSPPSTGERGFDIGKLFFSSS